MSEISLKRKDKEKGKIKDKDKKNRSKENTVSSSTPKSFYKKLPKTERIGNTRQNKN